MQLSEAAADAWRLIVRLNVGGRAGLCPVIVRTDSLAEAIDVAVDALTLAQHERVRVAAVNEVRWSDVTGLEPWGERTKLGTVHTCPLETDFAVPPGAVLVDVKGQDPEPFVEGYSIDVMAPAPDSPAVYATANVDAFRYEQVFHDLIDRLPAVDSLDVHVMHHWGEPDHREIFERPSTRGEVHGYLREHALDLLRSGFTEVGVWAFDDDVKLVLNEHRAIDFYAGASEWAARIGGWLDALAIPRLDSLAQLEYGYRHIHYRPGGTLDRTALRFQLQRDGFELLAHVDEED